jgi:hypothetical protein
VEGSALIGQAESAWEGSSMECPCSLCSERSAMVVELEDSSLDQEEKD